MKKEQKWPNQTENCGRERQQFIDLVKTNYPKFNTTLKKISGDK
jgi:hypothetical protein